MGMDGGGGGRKVAGGLAVPRTDAPACTVVLLGAFTVASLPTAALAGGCLAALASTLGGPSPHSSEEYADPKRDGIILLPMPLPIPISSPIPSGAFTPFAVSGRI